MNAVTSISSIMIARAVHTVDAELQNDIPSWRCT